MKPVLLLTLLYSLTEVHVSAQSAVCSENSLTATLFSNGMIGDPSSIGITESSSGSPLLKSMGIWFTATDNSGIMYASAHNSFNSSIHDFKQGPLTTAGLNASDPNAWNKVWAVQSDQIDFHKQNYVKPGYMAEADIKTWPGNGSAGYATILAPFIDRETNDMLYKPENGDYPYIQGRKMLYCIYNDVSAGQTYTSGNTLGLEIHTSVYSMEGVDQAKSETILYKVDVFNRSGRNYLNFILSINPNFNIGHWDDDYMYSSIEGNAVIGYNADDSDALLGKNPQSFAVISLSEPISGCMYLTEDNNVYSGSPDTDSQFYYLANGRWKNGQQLTFGGNGTNLSNPVCKFVYPLYDNAISPLPWTEDTTGNIPGKRFGLLNLKPKNLDAGQSCSYVFALSNVEHFYQSFKQKDSFCLIIKNNYKAGGFSSLNKMVHSDDKAFQIFPNPFINGHSNELNIGKEFTGILTIRDNVYKVLREINLTNQSNIPILDLNLNPGVYYLTFKKLNNNPSITTTLLIQ